ncbi:MAG: S9 family peptidase, partial [Chitinophagia bacterium]|nr:S9 family peptidase [Chitinophagia bacterium]
MLPGTYIYNIKRIHMLKPSITLLLLLFTTFVQAQKKPLDHSVYDGWQSIGERAISNDGKYVVYTVTPQEGDAMLYLKESNGKMMLSIPRGYGAAFSSDNAMLVCKIRPSFAATRDAKIKKKKPEEMPKDSLAIFNINTQQLTKIAQVKQFRLPEEGNTSWIAYWLEKV